MLLLVDDEEGLRRGLAAFLRRRGVAVREAGCLAEALEAAAAERPGWVVTDLKMEDGTGLDLAAWLDARPWPVRLILMTGYANRELLSGSPPAGVDLVLEKPVRPGRLAEKLAALGLGTEEEREEESRGAAATPPESAAARARPELRDALWNSGKS